MGELALKQAMLAAALKGLSWPARREMLPAQAALVRIELVTRRQAVLTGTAGRLSVLFRRASR